MPGKIGPAKPDRYMQPSILLALLEGESYGYELSQRVGEYGFLRGDVPPGMIYRHLRQMEDDRLVISRWEAVESGPAKRMYEVTQEGREVLAAWMGYMRRQEKIISDFVARYAKVTEGQHVAAGEASTASVPQVPS